MSLYLVTDRAGAVIRGRRGSECEEQVVGTVLEAVRGGVDYVQVREKHCSTRQFVDLTRRIKAACQDSPDCAHVQLIVNDRVDVALAADVGGLHIGRDDMDVSTAYKLTAHLPNRFLGVTVQRPEDIEDEMLSYVDMIGLGAMHATPTKDTTVIGAEGACKLMINLRRRGYAGKFVLIGGLNAETLEDTLTHVSSRVGELPVVAVVSAIMRSPEPRRAAEHLKNILNRVNDAVATASAYTWKKQAAMLAASVRQDRPLVHHITNLVVSNFSANATLALGASPFMTANTNDLPSLANVASSLVLNLGTLDFDVEKVLATLASTRKPTTDENHPAGRQCRTRLILDPVGCHFSDYRLSLALTCLATLDVALIKGNASEIAALAHRETAGAKGAGIDASATNSPVGVCDVPEYLADLTKQSPDMALNVQNAVKLAREYPGTTVVLTGANDVVTDGRRVAVLANGSPALADVTGTGCITGTAVAAMAGVSESDLFTAGIAGVLAVSLAGETDPNHGLGTYATHLMDRLSKLTSTDYSQSSVYQYEFKN